MNKEKTLYAIQTYNVVKAFLCGILPFFALVIAIIYIARYMNSGAFFFFGWVSVLSVPFFFQKQYKMLFTKRIKLEFDSEHFLIKEYTMKTNVLSSELDFPWSKIQSYRCSFPSSNVFYLTLYLQNGSTKRFSFTDEKNEDESVDDNKTFSIFYNHVKQYNLDTKPEDAIILKPGFLTTKSGTFFLYSLLLLIIVAIVIHFVLEPRTFALSFTSFFVILGLFLKRRDDMAFYNKINSLEPTQSVD